MSTSGILTLGLVSLLVAGLLHGCRPAPPRSKAETAPIAATVEMTNTLRFVPDTVRIPAGSGVRWKNTSMLVHTVTADPAEATLSGSVHLPPGASPFDSGNLAPGDSFQHTFTVPGEYVYFCQPHEGAKMRGVVLVEAAE